MGDHRPRGRRDGRTHPARPRQERRQGEEGEQLFQEQGGIWGKAKLKLCSRRRQGGTHPFLPQSRPCRVQSRCASSSPRAMASNQCPPSPLLVRVSEPGLQGTLRRKLERYFQSRLSGGGECTVRALGPDDPDIFVVKFLERAGEPRARAGGAKAVPAAQPRWIPGKLSVSGPRREGGRKYGTVWWGTETEGTC